MKRERQFSFARRKADAMHVLGAVLLMAGARFVSRAAELPPGFTEEVIANHLNAATALAVAPDGRVFIADQSGPLRVWKTGRLLPAPALDLAGRVDDFWERGLVGVTLHPDFPHTPHLFVLYVAKYPFTHHVVSRFTLLGDCAEAASELVLLAGDDQATFGGSQPGGHQGGPVCFGPDGKLYIALGEQTAGRPSQSLQALQGKILRLNPDGSIPSDNPFFGQASGKYRAIWALGLRNPFGLAFQPGTGRLFETDVGQSAWEEVNEIVRGGNYGWPDAEGFSTNVAFRNPLYAYPPAIGRSIVGGAFLPQSHLAEDKRRRASQSESAAPGAASHSEPDNVGFRSDRWRDKFFFADWAANWIKALDPDAPTNIVTFAKGFDGPVAIAFAPDDSMLVLNRGTIWRDGKKFMTNSGSLVRVRFTRSPAALARREATRPPLPRTLEASELFVSRTPLMPREAFVGIRINVQPWQPGVTVQRWISVPRDGQIEINQEGEFEFPVGTVVIQHHVVQKTRAPFETHLLWFTGPRQARAGAYRWNADGRNADLIEDGEIIALPGDSGHRWFSPGAEDNLNLDTVVAGFVLPVSPRQLPEDDLAVWNERGWLAPGLMTQLGAWPRLAALDNLSAPLELRVRSYLDANCACCHRPGGPSRGNFDARFRTPLQDQGILNGSLVGGDLGIPGARVIVPGQSGKSVMLQRITRNDAHRMPPVSVNDNPQPLTPLLKDWIERLDHSN